MDNTWNESLFAKRKDSEERQKLYCSMNNSTADHEKTDIVTSVDFVFIEGEGWKLESEQ